MTTEDITDRLHACIAALTEEVAGVTGVLVATSDGHPLTHTLPPAPDGEDSSLSTAAMVAALLGIGRRLATLTGDPRLLESTVRSPTGSIVVHALGPRAVMTVLTDATVNLARLNVAARQRVDELAGLVARHGPVDDSGGVAAGQPPPPPGSDTATGASAPAPPPAPVPASTGRGTR